MSMRMRDIIMSPAEEAHVFLEHIEFPLRKAGLIESAREGGASSAVVDMLKQIKDTEYYNAVDVLREIRGLAPHREVE